MAKQFDLYDATGKAVQSGVTSPITIADLKPNTSYSGYALTYAGETAKTVVDAFTTDDVVPGAPTVQVTADNAQAFVKIVAGENKGSALIAGKIYYTDGKNAKTQALKAGEAGTISGLTNGTEYSIQATVTNKAGESAKSAVVKATPKAATVAVTGVSLDKTTLALATGATGTVQATIAPSNATDKAYTFSSGDETIATVDNTGKITAVKAGTVDITVKTHDGGKTAKVTVTITNPVIAPTGITLDSKNATTVSVGNNIALVANIAPTNATDKGVIWSSSDATIATVDSAGKVVGVKAGSVDIIAKAHGDQTKLAKATVTVTAPAPEG